MALIKCPECGNEISDQAPKCIYCGYPLKEESAQQEQSGPRTHNTSWNDYYDQTVDYEEESNPEGRQRMEKKRVFQITILLIIVAVIVISCIVNSIFLSNRNKKIAEGTYETDDPVIELNQSITYLDSVTTTSLTHIGSEDGLGVYEHDPLTYYFNSNGTCVGFYTEDTIYDTTVDRSEIGQKILDYIKPAMGSLNYELGLSEYAEDIRQYTQVYYYCINGIKTQDFIYCTMDNCGNIISAGYPNQGEFSGVDLGEITSENIISTYEDDIIRIVGASDIDVTDYILDKDEYDQYYFDFTVDYTDVGGFSAEESVVIYLSR